MSEKAFWTMVLITNGLFWGGVFLYKDDYSAWISGTWAGEYYVGVEDFPRPGEGGFLTRSEVRYCLHEKVRLQILAEIVDFTLAHRYNTDVTDFNSRCLDYEFNLRENFAIESKLEGRKGILTHQALERVKKWRMEEANTEDYNSPYYAISTAIFLFDIEKIPHAKIIQQRLWELGFFDEEIDGIWGDISEAALIDFKRANNLGQSSTWDMATQQFLFGPEEVKSKPWLNKAFDDLVKFFNFTD